MFIKVQNKHAKYFYTSTGYDSKIIEGKNTVVSNFINLLNKNQFSI